MKKLIYIVISLIIGLVIGYLAFGGIQLSGTTNFGTINVSDGYKVDETTVIDKDGNVDASITSDTGTFSSTLDVSGETQLSTLVQGGSLLTLATSTAAARTLTAAEVCNNSVIAQQDWSGLASGTVTLTLPTVSLLYADCLDDQGDVKEIFFTNAASAVASTTQIVAGTNMILTESDNGADGDVLIAGGNAALIKVWRVGATATSNGIYAQIEELRDAD